MKKFLSTTIFIAAFWTSINAQVPQISLVQVATAYASPVDIQTCGDERLFIVEQKGIIRILYKDGTKQTTPFLDIDARVNSAQDEQGLIGLAFSPNYKQDGFFYVQYTTGPGVDSIRISRFSVTAGDSTTANPNSEQVLLSFKDSYWNHNGGSLNFGPDGYLYASQGDGGSGGDPQGNGQNKAVLMGKMLRIDVSNPAVNYQIPSTNPFVSDPNSKPEIWAYGLRNAWRCSFDKLTGDFWLADVGQSQEEEVNFQSATSVGGENYGWKCREGFSAYNGCTTPVSNFVQPVASLGHVNGACSITGGYVYRGAQYSKLFGKYLFTDYCNGQIWTVLKDGSVFDLDTLQNFDNYQYTSFGQDNKGELYLAYRGSASGSTGRIYRITETSSCNPVAFISFEDSVASCGSVALKALKGDTLSYQWYSTSGVVNGANTNEFLPTQNGWYKVEVSKTQNPGCKTMSDSVYVTLADTTVLTTSSLGSFCTYDSPVSLQNFVSPSGGVYSGSGVVSGNSFNPGSAVVGNNAVEYIYENTQGCTSQIALSIEVNDKTPIVKSFPDTVYCSNVSPVELTNYFSPAGGVFSGNAVSGSSFNPAQAINSTDAWVYYEFTNNKGCVTIDSFQMQVEICSGIDDRTNNLNIHLNPNPAKDRLFVSLSSVENTSMRIELLDATGRKCFEKVWNVAKGVNKTELQFQLPGGVYTLIAGNERNFTSRRLIIE
jgi:glucose/arabinose dehydrogenase